MARRGGAGGVRPRAALLLIALALPLHAADAPPSPELLEFLGEWTDGKGVAIDPFALPKLDTKNAALKKESGDDDEKDAR